MILMNRIERYLADGSVGIYMLNSTFDACNIFATEGQKLAAEIQDVGSSVGNGIEYGLPIVSGILGLALTGIAVIGTDKLLRDYKRE